jgi:antitoxin (DNA-binding transcriptional repressor) of toxin-antitoxin stability system
MSVKRAIHAIIIEELERHTRDVLQRLREAGKIVDLMDGDEVIAQLVPMTREVDRAALAEWRKRHEELVLEIDKHWPEGVSAADAIADVRRDL